MGALFTTVSSIRVDMMHVVRLQIAAEFLASIRVSRVSFMVSVRNSVKCAWIFPVINGLCRFRVRVRVRIVILNDCLWYGTRGSIIQSL